MTDPDSVQAMGAQKAADGDATRLFIESFVAGLGECADPRALVGLRAGATLRLRRTARPRQAWQHEVLTMDGRPLGRLPREDADWLEALGLRPEAASARVAALVPGLQRPRILIRIALPSEWCDA